MSFPDVFKSLNYVTQVRHRSKMWFLTSHSVVQRSPAYTDTASCRLSSHNLLQNYTERNKNTRRYSYDICFVEESGGLDVRDDTN